MNILNIIPSYSFTSSEYWLNVAEAARRSNCSVQSVRENINKGKFSAMKRYGKWLVNTKSLLNYLRDKDQPKEIERPIAVGWQY